MPTWYLIRHGKTIWNQENRVQGNSDTLLSDQGLLQIKRLPSKLATANFTAAYSSDLLRCVNTAQAAIEGRELTVQLEPAMRECSYGEWEGLLYTEIRDRYPDGYARYHSHELDFSPPGGGESVKDIFARVSQFSGRLRATHSEEDLLVVGHSGSLSALVVAVLGLPIEKFWQFQAAPASLSLIEVGHSAPKQDLGAVLTRWNDTSHLEGLDHP